MSNTAGVEFEHIADGFYLEALVVNGENIWYTDVVLGGVRQVGSDAVLLPDRIMVGGLLQNGDGALLVSGAGGIVWAHPENDTTGSLVEGLDAVNEMTADRHGGVVFGTIDLPAILRGEKPGASSLYRLSTDGELTQIWEGLTFANGLAFNVKGDELYFNESFSASRAFNVDKNGILSGYRVLADMPDCDGMALDAEGNIWLTGFGSDFLRCVAPDGSELRRLSLPGKAATNVRFGGPDLRDMYVTIVDPRSAQALADGRPLTERNSAILRFRSPVPGAPSPRTSFAL